MSRTTTAPTPWRTMWSTRYVGVRHAQFRPTCITLKVIETHITGLHIMPAIIGGAFLADVVFNELKRAQSNQVSHASERLEPLLTFQLWPVLSRAVVNTNALCPALATLPCSCVAKSKWPATSRSDYGTERGRVERLLFPTFPCPYSFILPAKMFM